MSDSTTDGRKYVGDLVRDAKVAMLTTMTADGKHVSRPMGLQEAEFDATGGSSPTTTPPRSPRSGRCRP